MREALSSGGNSAAIDHEGGTTAAFGAANLLCLAAAPTFAIMALLTGILGGTMDMHSAAMMDASPLSGMVPMYVLMSAFHSAPWLKQISNRRRRRGGLV